MQQAPPPGWYADPQGTGQRWWDGSSWTEHRQAPPLPQQQPQAGDGDARTWAMAAHLSALAAMLVGFAFLGPLIVYLVKKEEDPFVREQAAEALNFNLSWLIYALVGAIAFVITFFLFVGLALIPVFILGAMAWLVLVIMAGVKASKGEAFRYPLTIRFVQ
jgi:hypothetical protein